MRNLTAIFAIVLFFNIVTQSTALRKQPPIVGILISPYIIYENSTYCISYSTTRSNSNKNPPIVKVSDSLNISSGCVWSVYVQWLQMSGLRVLPIPWNANQTYMAYLLDRVNGVLLPGGVLLGHPVIDVYFEVVQWIVGRATKVYNTAQNDGFVVYGTCQGFEMLFSAAAGTMHILSEGFVGTDPRMLPVHFLQNETILFQNMPASLRSAMEVKNLTLNLHTKGVEPQTVAQLYPNVTQLLTPTSVSYDDRGVAFFASVESPPPYRVFGTQFHPERPCFDFDTDVITHTPEVLQVAQMLSMRLRELVQESKHHFEDPNEAERLLIDNVPLTNLGWGMEVYYF